MADGFRVLENGDSRISEADEFRVTQGYFWDGPRETEAGDLRITEASVFRVTEKFIEGENDLQGVGSLTALQSYKTLGYFDIGAEGYCASVATKISPGATALTGTGTLGPTGLLSMPVFSSLNGTGSITSNALVGKFGLADLSATGSISIDADITLKGEVSLSATASKLSENYGKFSGATHNFDGVATISAAGQVVAYRSADLNGVGTLDTLQTFTATGSSALNASGSLTTTGLRIRPGATSLSATGSISIVPLLKIGLFTSLSAQGTLAADGTETDFSSTMYYKVGSNWKTTLPYVKRSGTWVSPTAVYKNISGSWKRVY